MKQTIKNILKTLGFIFLLLGFTSIPLAILGIDYSNLQTNTKIIYSLICDIIFLSFIIFCYRKTLIQDFKEFKKDIFKNLEYAFKFWLVGFIIMVISNLFIIYVIKGGIAENEEAVRNLINISPIYMLFEVAIYAPLTEELIFRKSIRDIFKNKWAFIITSGFVFGALHVISSVETTTDLLFLIPYCSLGFTFAYLYYKSNNIFSSISMHAMHNTMAIILYLIGASL